MSVATHVDYARLLAFILWDIGFYCLILSTSGCGVGAEFEHPTIVRCTNGRTLDLREWTPYMGVGGPSFIVNKRTGETITDDGKTKCYPVEDSSKGDI